MSDKEKTQGYCGVSFAVYSKVAEMLTKGQTYNDITLLFPIKWGTIRKIDRRTRPC